MDKIIKRTELIQSLFLKYGSDKAQHGYAEFYAHHLPENPKSILEIGVKEGASIRAWKELFPNAEIHGFDLFEEYPIPNIEGVKFHKGNQLYYAKLEQLREFNFDVIIDDGSHNSRDQMVTFFGLFHDNCRYFIEDLQCCDESFYRQGLPEQFTAKYLFPVFTQAYSRDYKITMIHANKLTKAQSSL